MVNERFVVLGLARARAEWFSAAAQWATTAALPLEFVKCVSGEELRTHLASGRPFSAAILDGALPATDRDLIGAVREAGAVALVVQPTTARRVHDWHALGAAAVLPSQLTREDLLDSLASHCSMVGLAHAPRDEVLTLPAGLGRVIAVTGSGGTGASMAAIALAQELVRHPRYGPVLVADLALKADQAMLNDVRDITPGVQELVEAHRSGNLTTDDVRALTFLIQPRGFWLLLGLRRSRYWSVVQRRAFAAALGALQRAFGTVVCDVTGDVEGEQEGGSADVEDRNLMARTAVLTGDAVVVVGVPGLKGIHALARLLRELLEVGVPGSRLIPVVNHAPRSPRQRAEMCAALAELVADASSELAAPVFLPSRRVETALADLAPLPSSLGTVLAGAVDATLRRSTRRASPFAAVAERIVPGSLPAWSDERAG